MEQRFGHDFARVRVHSGAAAGESAEENELRREHGLPERGESGDPLCGESYRYPKRAKKRRSTVTRNPSAQREGIRDLRK
jgi:hypothetical protein